MKPPVKAGRMPKVRTALHELGYATGHKTRLKRDLSGGFGSQRYAREELRAKIGSYMLNTNA